jgi:predicted HicB family RNase H-like nuclease
MEGAMKQTTIRLPEELLKRARIYAVEHDTSLQALIIEGLAARLENKRST